MEFVHVLSAYILWHYTRAWGDMLRITGNYLWFTQNFFSMGLLSRTLFAPWRRLAISGGRGTGETFVGAVIVNTLMRVVGFGIRVITIVIGAVSLFGVIVLAALAFALWPLLPVIVFVVFFAGIGQVFL